MDASTPCVSFSMSILTVSRLLPVTQTAVQTSWNCGLHRAGKGARWALVHAVLANHIPPQAKWLYLSESVVDLLGASDVVFLLHFCNDTDRIAGWEPADLIGTPSLNLVHPDEYDQVKAMHYSTITQDRAAVLAYLRMRHKDPYKGYVLCAIVRTTYIV